MRFFSVLHVFGVETQALSKFKNALSHLKTEEHAIILSNRLSDGRASPSHFESLASRTRLGHVDLNLLRGTLLSENFAKVFSIVAPGQKRYLVTFPLARVIGGDTGVLARFCTAPTFSDSNGATKEAFS